MGGGEGYADSTTVAAISSFNGPGTADNGHFLLAYEHGPADRAHSTVTHASNLGRVKSGITSLAAVSWATAFPSLLSSTGGRF